MTVEELSRAVVTTPGFRCMDRMRVAVMMDDEPSDPVWGTVYVCCDRVWIGSLTSDYGHDEVVAVDLVDPATAGCLLALVMQRWPGASCSQGSQGDFVVAFVATPGIRQTSIRIRGATLGEACARALLGDGVMNG
jgi:hypothetical protein